MPARHAYKTPTCLSGIELGEFLGRDSGKQCADISSGCAFEASALSHLDRPTSGCRDYRRHQVAAQGGHSHSYTLSRQSLSIHQMCHVPATEKD